MTVVTFWYEHRLEYKMRRSFEFKTRRSVLIERIRCDFIQYLTMKGVADVR